MLNFMVPAVRLRLGEILRERGMTQKQLAGISGLSENAVSKLTGRPRQIRLDTIDRVCEVLEIQPGDLIIREETS